MALFWGRQTLGCHGLSYALLFSALHEGMITLLGCLSSYVWFSYPFKIGSRVADRTAMLEFTLFPFSSVSVVESQHLFYITK